MSDFLLLLAVPVAFILGLFVGHRVGYVTGLEDATRRVRRD